MIKSRSTRRTKYCPCNEWDDKFV